MPVPNTINVQIVGDIRVTVPASPKLMTTYILTEQRDWFEDEIKFIRLFIKPGMNVIDIGANYGCYTLCMAKITGDSGKVWAIEPAEATARCLGDSIQLNNFNNIELIQAGLSITPGHAELFISQNSELNSLSRDAVAGDLHETVELCTLDQCQDEYGWKNIDFIKLDAEGEEINILKGGEQMLDAMSPLIMFELKHGSKVNLPLIRQFVQMGYDCYRLVPGLNALVPFDCDGQIDAYLLNLFCCKTDKSGQLEDAGILVREWGEMNAPPHTLAHEYIGNLAYASQLDSFSGQDAPYDRDEYLDILSTYIMTLSASASSHDRLSGLMQALGKMCDMYNRGEQNIARLVTFSRIAFDAGERQLGVEILGGLIEKYSANNDFALDELFLPASERYEGIAPGTRVNEWLMSSIIEQYILKVAYSTYFTGRNSLPLFARLQQLGFMSEDMQRRYHLLASRFFQ